MKTLFLFTKTYPYGHGEQYITDELGFVAEDFEKVIIYPNDYYGTETTHDKKLPVNVEVLNFNKSLSAKNKNGIADYVYLLKNTALELLETDDKTSFFKNFKWNLVNFWTQYQLAKNFGQYLKKNNYTAANAVFYSYWFHKSVILLSVLKDKNYISKFIARAHSIDLYHQYWGVINNDAKVPSFKLFKYRHIFNIITISNHGLNFIKKHFPKYSNKAINFYLGVSANTDFKTKNENDPFLIVTCSHLDWTKRVDKLAEALINIKQPCKWVHFGGGSQVELDKINALAKKMPANIQFDMKGYVLNSEVINFYKNNYVDLFINLSLVEGVPVSIMEAISYGIPVMATAVYGTPEIVIDGQNGFLIDVDFSIDQLTGKLNHCFINKEQLSAMRKKSYALSLEKFNAQKNYTEFADYLRSL